MTSWGNWQSGANPFISAAKILSATAVVGSQQLKGEKASQFWLSTMIPVIVMKAFSCELMLKTLIAHEGLKMGKNHKLDELFDKLPASIQAIIQAPIIAKMKIRTTSYDETSFLEDLKASSTLFVDWRYFFEEATSGKEKTVNLAFLDVLFTELETLKNSLS